ncbi:MAG: DMT family transporter [Heliobacteriaceae bacterium]|jgi:drug/metabolite transporter (DMT)-like permease|nr:DMT family transporter [Heliobacteriaceae bacterium]
MKYDFLKLHLSVVLAGFTGIFGKLVSLNEGLLVWYRLLISFLILFAVLLFANKVPKVNNTGFLKISGTGALLALHFLFFYGSIKYSNVSVGVVCYSLTGFFTAIFEPVMAKRRFDTKEILYSLIAAAGILLIFNFDTGFRFGIILGVIASALAAVFTIANKIVEREHSSTTMLFYEFLGAAVFMSAILPLYLHFNPVQTITPAFSDWGYLLILAFFCTIGQYILHIQALKTLSAFTVSLSGNLEPLYGILTAICFLGEAQQLSAPFYAGIFFIIFSVFVQSAGSGRLAAICEKSKSQTYQTKNNTYTHCEMV